MAKKKCPAFENHERWLVSYADMLTLLFALFVVLYALKEDGAPASTDAAGSIQESFNKPLDDIPHSHRIGPSEAGFGIFDHFKGNQARPPLSKKFPGVHEKNGLIDDEMLKTKKLLEERLYGPNKNPRGDVAGSSRLAEVTRTEGGFKIKLMTSHFFPSGSISLSKSGKSNLDKILAIVKNLERKVTVEGHTDSIPPGGRLNNWDLSALRSTSVLRRMIQNHNYPATTLKASGYGDTKPIASNSTEEGRSLNRRIELKIEYDDDSFMKHN